MTDSDLDLALLASVKAGDGYRASRLLAAGADINATDPAGLTPLHGAVFNGDTALVDLLLAAPGIDVNRAEGPGAPALIAAVAHGYIDIVTALVAFPGTDIDRLHDGKSALLTAVAVNDRDLAETLLTRADRSVAARADGFTVEDFAAGCGRVLRYQLAILDLRHRLPREGLWNALAEGGAIAGDGTLSGAVRGRRWSAAFNLPPGFAGDAQVIQDFLEYCARGDRRTARLVAG
ncbi:MAG: ankyrin repeat domain-containing protein [Alphaproteobacteria bacterium]|nr:ankyrin repeat domain-containing protein [Alphaproteobacteria bacterium]